MLCISGRRQDADITWLILHLAISTLLWENPKYIKHWLTSSTTINRYKNIIKSILGEITGGLCDAMQYYSRWSKITSVVQGQLLDQINLLICFTEFSIKLEWTANGSLWSDGYK